MRIDLGLERLEIAFPLHLLGSGIGFDQFPDPPHHNVVFPGQFPDFIRGIDAAHQMEFSRIHAFHDVLEFADRLGNSRGNPAGGESHNQEQDQTDDRVADLNILPVGKNIAVVGNADHMPSCLA